jgi:hypothetical protein
LGYINRSDTNELGDWLSGNYEIEVAGKRFPARASLAPLFDPENERIRR